MSQTTSSQKAPISSPSMDQQPEDDEFYWGFVIYRGVYTEASNTTWPVALERIHDYARQGLGGYLRRYQDPEELRSQYKSTILEDPSIFDGATIDQLRNHFRDWFKTMGPKGIYCSNTFIVVDEECLNSILAAPEKPDWSKEYYYKIVDAGYDLSLPLQPASAKGTRRGGPTYRYGPGWMKAAIWLHYRLWMMFQKYDFEE